LFGFSIIKFTVERISDEQLNAILNSDLFEGDIQGIDTTAIHAPLLRDEPTDPYDYIFKLPVHLSIVICASIFSNL
uniref:Transmembrane protein 231 n=1 Tax=Gongylonema pulchrum TaxID=637853 RepID=A0A183DI08_9BILA